MGTCLSALLLVGYTTKPKDAQHPISDKKVNAELPEAAQTTPSESVAAVGMTVFPEGPVPTERFS